jgi:hypothetical protein
MISRREASSDWSGAAEAPGGRIHQGSVPFHVASQSCISQEEEWEVADVFRLHRVK